MASRYPRRNGATTAPFNRGGASRTGPRSTTPRGLFADGVWHCDCSPRLPAEHFRVKKEGKNQGRWFYTCQNLQDKRCGFFLWDEDAKVREEGAVLEGSRTEAQGRQNQEASGRGGLSGARGRRGGMFAGVDPKATGAGHAVVKKEDSETETEDESPPPPYPTQGRQKSRLKRSADAAALCDDADSDDEAFPWPLTGQEEAALSKATDALAPPETPRKAVNTGVYATPSLTTEKKPEKVWLEDQPATPSTYATPSQPEDYFATPSRTSSKILPQIPEDPTTPFQPQGALVQAPHSPSPPTRQKDALSNPADASSSLTDEALATLSSTTLPPEKLSALRSVLSKHDLKTQGVVKGRDITRLALKAKDAKIVELQAKVARLEAERKVDRGVIRGLREGRELGGSEDVGASTCGP